jgi:hypothetical protein
VPKHSPFISFFQYFRLRIGCIGYNRSIYYYDLGIYYEYHHQHDIIIQYGSLRYSSNQCWNWDSITTYTAIGSSQDATNQAKRDPEFSVERHTTPPFNIALTDILHGNSGMFATRQIQERP